LHRERRKAIRCFFLAWRNRPFSIIPFKKAAKGALQALINYGGNDPANITAKPWTKNIPPKKILAIRLQATGDVTVTLPYLQHLRHTLPPTTNLDFLTRKECESIPKSIYLFNKVISIGGKRNFRKQLFHTYFLLPKLLMRHYDIVLDLQNNEISELVRKSVHPSAWSVFDRFSSRSAGERTMLTIEAVGLGKNDIKCDFHFKGGIDSIAMLRKNGWNGTSELVVLNPAGAFSSRNWPLKNYVSFANLWSEQFPGTQFLVLGTSLISSNAAYLKERLGDRLVDLTAQTTTSEAFAILQHARFILSEDSGLMHMAWISGIPTLVLFGSTRSDWSKPLGIHSFYLDSSDLPCGNCMQEVCRYGDVHCLTRYDPEMVFSHAVTLVKAANTVTSPRTV
jgi:heptosyltransferase II